MSTFFDIYSELCARNGIAPCSARASELFGVSTASLSHWKKGAAPKAATLQRIADYFGVSVSYLLTGQEYTAPAQVFGKPEQLQHAVRTITVTPEEMEQLQWLRSLSPEKLEALKTLLGK